jgi:hypothetical protein
MICYHVLSNSIRQGCVVRLLWPDKIDEHYYYAMHLSKSVKELVPR